jgi:hypothetical protein
VFTAIDAFAGPARLTFTGDAPGVQAQAGDRVTAGMPITLRADIAAPDLVPTLTLYRDGTAAATVQGSRLVFAADGSPGVYRIEATLPLRPGGRPVAPWLVSNPIYIGPATPFTPAPPPAPVESRALYRDGPSPLVVEHSELSQGAITVVPAQGGTQLSLRFALGGKQSDAPFVAFASPAPEIASYSGVRFIGRANRPMRISVQLRVSQQQGSSRWRRSVYLDQTARTIVVPFNEFQPIQRDVGTAPPLTSVTSLLFVLDTMNTALGSNGEFWLDDLAFVR